jgi:hypothetical protein
MTATTQDGPAVAADGPEIETRPLEEKRTNMTENTLTIAGNTYTVRKRVPVSEIPGTVDYTCGVVVCKMIDYTTRNVDGQEVDVVLPEEAFAGIRRSAIRSVFQWEDLTVTINSVFSSSDSEVIDGIEYVDLELWSRIPCPAVSWCEGHDYEDLEGADPFAPDFGHERSIGSLVPLYRPETSIDFAEAEASGVIVVKGPEDQPKLNVLLKVEDDYDLFELGRLATDLRALADRLETFDFVREVQA